MSETSKTPISAGILVLSPKGEVLSVSPQLEEKWSLPYGGEYLGSSPASIALNTLRVWTELSLPSHLLSLSDNCQFVTHYAPWGAEVTTYFVPLTDSSYKSVLDLLSWVPKNPNGEWGIGQVKAAWKKPHHLLHPDNEDLPLVREALEHFEVVARTDVQGPEFVHPEEVVLRSGNPELLAQMLRTMRREIRCSYQGDDLHLTLQGESGETLYRLTDGDFQVENNLPPEQALDLYHVYVTACEASMRLKTT